MKQLLLFLACIKAFSVMAQTPDGLTLIKEAKVSAVKNQGQTGTCWCFSGVSLAESNCMQKNKTSVDLSEMYVVRNTYIEKARNYVLRQGKTQFSEGGLGHDPFQVIDKYGAMPETAYSGIKSGFTGHNHANLFEVLKLYVDSIIKLPAPIQPNWIEGYTHLLDKHLGVPPSNFDFQGVSYTPLTFAKQVLKESPDDYVYLTSFTHHPYYESFILEVPDNFSDKAYFNVPLEELIMLTKKAVHSGQTVLWDTDVSNEGWLANSGFALYVDGLPSKTAINAAISEKESSATIRQAKYETLETQDDHLMHIIGLYKNKQGKEFFKVKNSWGAESNPYGGMLYASTDYFAINTISLVIHKSALPKKWLKKYKL